MPRLKFISALVAAFTLGAAVVLVIVYAKSVTQPGAQMQKTPVQISNEDVLKLILYARLRDGYLEGSYFNQVPDTQVVRITVETTPKDDTNPFNKFTPKLFNISATAQPRSMSTSFRVETGALNPDFHTLKIVEALGIPSP